MARTGRAAGLAGLRWLLVQLVRCVLRGGAWCCVGGGGRYAARFFYPKVPFLDFLLDYFPLYFYPSFLGVRVCVCLLKMGLKNVSPWNLELCTMSGPEAWDRKQARPDEHADENGDGAEEEVAAVGSAEPVPIGGNFGSGASPMSLSSRAVLCLTGWLGMLLIS